MPAFNKILIANRGEIACRVIKTAQTMGIATAAVYSDADVRALHVQYADEAVHIGAAPASESYLSIDKIIDACKQTGAQAVHPGYGFLSENAEFASRLAAENIAFIGPNIRAIKVMGDKIESKKFADEAKISTVPGHLGVIENTDEAMKIADAIGYPVMIKASAGGGGKGMRIAYSRDEVAEGFASSTSEARSSFGDERVFIEKFITNPRHIEIQVLADKHGNILHLAERECSIQRRNQKVVEEAPSIFLDEATRSAMGEQAVALAKAVGYESAGTVEFIVDKARNFYFLEMNTRLQVEHPVTELITGIDLVEQMIRVAAGEKLAFGQGDVKLNGWAIESRIYAEDPLRGFLPSTGRLVRYRPPEEGTNDAGLTIRNDTGVYEGGEISVFYDPMIAKLCTHGPDRLSATRHMAVALDEFHISGIQHNISFLSALMEHPRWISGEITTGFIAEEYPNGFVGVELSEEARLIMGTVAISIDHVMNSRKRAISEQMDGTAVRFSQRRSVRLGEEDWLTANITGQDDDHFKVTVLNPGDDTTLDKVRVVRSNWVPGNPVWKGFINNKAFAVQVSPILNGVLLSWRGVQKKACVFTDREAELARLMPVKLPPDLSSSLRCPMPGLIVSLHVAKGDEVKAGQTLCVVEAMKMENVLKAERDATVGEIKAAPGDILAVDDIILEFV